MAGRIPDETLRAIRDRISLVEVISAYVSLKRAGRNHTGLCPFHSEKTPSFTVSEERGLFHCFGCGASGTVFHFVMKMERIEFPEAVEQLAKRAGVALPARRDDDPAAPAREKLYAANAEGAAFFQKSLSDPTGAAARRYLGERGVEAEAMERYALGFAPAGGSVLSAWLGQHRVAREVALQAGLLGQRADGGLYDRFRGRLMFPIRDRRARIIGFGGRTLGTDQPKYLNSPESPVFQKGETLYGLSEARDAIRSAGRVILVEGYLDALLMAQEGFPYTVATLGTALTVSQVRLLLPLGGEGMELLFCFDGDVAGRRAAVRAFDVCAQAGAWGRAVFLPEGFDPDSYVRAHGREAMQALLQAAPTLSDFYFDQVVPAGAPLPQRVRAAEQVREILSHVRNDLQFELLARQAATRLGLDEDVFRRARTGTSARATPAPRTAAPPEWPPAEMALLETMLDPEVAAWATEHDHLALLSATEIVEAGRKIAAAHDNGSDLGEVIAALPEALAQRLSAVLLGGGPLGEADRMQIAQDCVRRLEEQAERRRRQALTAELRHAETVGDESWRTKLEGLRELRRRDGGVG